MLLKGTTTGHKDESNIGKQGKSKEKVLRLTRVIYIDYSMEMLKTYLQR